MNRKFRNSLKILIMFSFILSSILLPRMIGRTESVIAVEATSIKVAFDETHDPSWSSAGFLSYSSFRNSLETFYNVSILETEIDEEMLSSIDILIIAASKINYTSSEINDIENWVKTGGSVLLISDYQKSTGEAVMEIANRFGFEQKFDLLIDTNDNVGQYSWIIFSDDNIHSHNITAGVNRIEIYAGGGIIEAPENAVHLVTTDTDNTAFWSSNTTEANGVPVVSVLGNSSSQYGKIALVTDGNFLSAYDQDGDGTDNFFDSDNEILAVNIVKWLADKEYGSLTNSTSLTYRIIIILILIPLFLQNIIIRKLKKKIQ